MEIKSINTSQKISKVHTASKNELAFGKDEIIFAKIVSIDGETVTLKTREDMLFTAKILSDLKLAVGDDLKLAVKGRHGGKFIMQALSVNPDLVDIFFENTQQSEESKLILVIANLLKKFGIEPTTGKVNDIIGGMEKNPGLDVKTAVFMTANEIAFTEENVEAVKQLESGNALISNELLEILGHIVLSETLPETEDAQAVLKLLSEHLSSGSQAAGTEVSRMPESGEGAKAINISVDAQRHFYSVTPARTPAKAFAAEAAAGEEVLPAGSGGAGTNAEAAVHAARAKEIISSLFDGGGKTDFENVRGFINEDEAGAPQGRNMLQDKAVQELLSKILTMFSRTKDARTAGEEIKTGGERKTEELLQLKQMLKNSDIKNRDVLANRLDKTISQSRLVSEINRYTLLHIPVNMGSERQTAEVYIYRRKKKAGKTDPQEIKILIGLDTENLGRFEVLVAAKGKNLSVQMARGDDKANEVIGLRIKKLKKSFSELGYNLSDFTIERLREKTTPANAEEVLMGEVSQSSFKINYTV